ncbi:MAG: hypothetical protein ACRC7R_00145 [Sarcina sp.]
MKGAISRKDEKFYTYMKRVFSAINNVQNEYNWLITNCECYPQNEKYAKMLSEDYLWITGEQLTNMIEKENFQWIWGVLSGFKKDIILEEVLRYDLPYADGYSGFWSQNITIQHKLAHIEIASIDSSLVLLISKENTIIDNFKKDFLLAEDLKEFNSKFK